MVDGRLKIIVEDKIPFIKGVMESYAYVEYLVAEMFKNDTVKDADAIIIRTRTRCDENLLKGSRCALIASATIGTDHIDKDYCKRNNIRVVNAPGCNAPGVAQYVLSSILTLYPDPTNMTLGVVGVGHIGSIVAEWAKKLGMNVLLNDPPRERTESKSQFVSLKEIADKSDIITFHVPLNQGGIDNTYHLVDENFIANLMRNPLLINAARGPILDTTATLDGLSSGKISNVVIDCWEGEPLLNRCLLEKSVISTPHIAGYSYEGKIRATRMVVDAITEHFNLKPIEWKDKLPDLPHKVTKESILSSYNPLIDSKKLKESPSDFEKLRNNYSYRHEVR